MTLPTSGLLFVVSGPAGVGKTTLCNHLLAEQDNLNRIVTATTREPRPGEVSGVDYHFLSEAEFQQKLDHDGFYEFAQVHGRLYGTPREEVDQKLREGKDVLLNIDVQGAASFRKAATLDPTLGDRLITIFITIASLAELKKRILNRGPCEPEEMERRLESARREMERQGEFDYLITSESREGDYDNFQAIYRAEKLRLRAQ